MTDFNDPNRLLIEEFRAHKGALSGRFEGSPILLLTTAGARSGLHHTTPMMYRREGERLLVFASGGGGARKTPDWFHNLVAHPEVTVEIGPDTYEATAVVTDGDERERLFAETVVDYPFIAEHEQKAGRQIPVVALQRA